MKPVEKYIRDRVALTTLDTTEQQLLKLTEIVEALIEYIGNKENDIKN